MPVWMRPTISARRIAPLSRSASGTTRRAESTAIEIALVGPLISCLDESKRAPTAVTTIAV